MKFFIKDCGLKEIVSKFAPRIQEDKGQCIFDFERTPENVSV